MGDVAGVAGARDAADVNRSYCGHCGRRRDEGDHSWCDDALRLEPPRYCTACRRRLVVQVTPRGWSARCSRHGEDPVTRKGTSP